MWGHLPGSSRQPARHAELSSLEAVKSELWTRKLRDTPSKSART
jgi:hypothetical protein